jgi:hypothetical protein
VLILHPRLVLTVTDTVRDVEPDALIVWPGSGRPRLGEVKSYADHGHRTDATDLAKTRQQAAVYALALEEAVGRLQLPPSSLRGPWPGEEIDPRQIVAVAVLRRPQSMYPSMGLEFIERDVELVRRGLRRTPSTLGEILATLPPGARLDDAAVLRALPASYEPAWCLGNCPLASSCREDARAAGHPALFGGETPAVLASVPDLGRIHTLATRPAAAPEPSEQALADRMRLLHARMALARQAC